jgi:hypothetical protein
MPGVNDTEHFRRSFAPPRGTVLLGSGISYCDAEMNSEIHILYCNYSRYIASRKYITK